jgi:eukaryotic-like serine/threonine-protein kinase
MVPRFNHKAMDATSHSPAMPARPAAVRMFGRLQLMQLLGKSERTMAWRVIDSRNGTELVLMLPRVQPVDKDALQRWNDGVRQSARLSHPQLAPVLEVGTQDGWPYATYDASGMATLVERLAHKAVPGAEAALLASQVMRGLAFAHEAGVAHNDLQAFCVLVADNGSLRIAGLAVASEVAVQGDKLHAAAASASAPARTQRESAERDVLAGGLLLHALLAGMAALEDTDLGRVIARLPPTGRDIVRLPWTTPQPVSDALRAIVNRATDRQERQRYRSARTFLRALDGWLQAEGSADAGPLALLADRLRTAGVLPTQPGVGQQAARLALMERERTMELAEVVLQDLALAFEMLRLVNSAQVRNAQAAGSGPVLTMRRAIAMLGLDSVRRAALAIRPWPGPLDEAAAAELSQLIDRCKQAGRVALALRPAGYDEEVVVLITALQNLGRLIVQYHFPDEAQQIARLTQPAPSPREGESEEPGMSEESAAFAVLGADVEAIGLAVARSWGLHDSLVHMMRRLPVGTPVRASDSDDEIVRALASCANEAVDALGLPAARQLAALQKVVARYGRQFDMTLRDLHAALLGQPLGSVTPTAHAPLDAGPVSVRGGLRTAMAGRAAR